jgi:hypothetical protein
LNAELAELAENSQEILLCGLPPPLAVISTSFGEARRSASGAKAAAFP